MKSRGLHVKIIPVQPSFGLSPFVGSTNCIVIWRKDSAVVVDPGGESAKISRFLKRCKLRVCAYWLTHAHPDHVGGLLKLLDEYPASVRYHRDDTMWMRFSLPFRGSRKAILFEPFGRIHRIVCDDIDATVILAPGHTPGGVCYWLKEIGVLLTGDTLMRGYVGATVYPGGDASQLKNSIRRIFRRVPDETKVLSGHGRETTVGAERLRSR